MAFITRLSAKEKLFCALFAGTGRAELSAREAGYENVSPALCEELLCKQKIADEIGRLEKQRGKLMSAAATAGYRRLAFGDISDAVALLFMDKPSPKELKSMDLFSVSEIKVPKDGAMEIRFFDRLKALEKLESRGEDTKEAKSLFDAIGRSAQTSGSEEND